MSLAFTNEEIDKAFYYLFGQDHASNRFFSKSDQRAASVILNYLDSLERDLSSEAFVILMRKASQPVQPVEIRYPRQYMRGLIKNLQTAEWRSEARRRKREETFSGDIRLTEKPSWGDPEKSLENRENLATAQNRVREVLQVAAARGDHKLAQVATAWLDLASELDRDPSSRELAEHLGVSHQTIRNRLKRLGTLTH